MTDGALHVQHKDQEIFDRQNRVIPMYVVAVSDDTGDVRFGNGTDTWRNLPKYGAGDGEASEEPREGFSGPLHITVLSDEDFDSNDESTTVMSRVPANNEMFVLGTQGVVFGDGFRNLGSLPRIGG